MFGFTIWLVIGGIVGWTASVLKRTGKQQEILASIVVGIVGAYAGGALLAPFVRVTPSFTYLVALGGSLAMVGGYELVRRARPR